MEYMVCRECENARWHIARTLNFFSRMKDSRGSNHTYFFATLNSHILDKCSDPLISLKKIVYSFLYSAK